MTGQRQTPNQDTSITPGSEASLLVSFKRTLQENIRFRGSDTTILLPELSGIQGRADLVVAHIKALPRTVGLDELATCLSSPAKAQLLALLKFGAPRRREYIAKHTGFSHRSLGDHTRQLEKAGLVKVHDSGAISLACPLPWTMVEVTAYEGKLSNWRRAMYQAIQYRSFSRRVWIVMPPAGAQHARRILTLFHMYGVGLISATEDGIACVEIKSRSRRPTNRRLYLMAVGLILKEFLTRRRRLHRRLRPESIQGV